MKVIIVGNGKMAQLFFVGLTNNNHTVMNLLEAGAIQDNSDTVALHVGSGRQLTELVQICSKFRIPILNGSTGLKEQLKGIEGTAVVNAENFALPILRLIHVLPGFAHELERDEFAFSRSVTESHQSSKKTLPGTAVRIANAIGLSKESIVSVRDDSVQAALGVPVEHLDGHGYHWINWAGAGVQIQLITKVNGREAYLKGGMYLLKELARRSAFMGNGHVDVLDFLSW